MTPEELHEMLTALIGKPLQSVAVMQDFGVMMLCFPEGKTLYVAGEKLSIEIEAPN